MQGVELDMRKAQDVCEPLGVRGLAGATGTDNNSSMKVWKHGSNLRNLRNLRLIPSPNHRGNGVNIGAELGSAGVRAVLSMMARNE
jgi:hypothetical protein